MGGGAAGGVAMTFERQATAKSRLEIEWDHPVYTPEGASSATAGQTVARSAPRALDAAVTYATLGRDDPRPLLVLRECGKCKGTDDALLDRRLSNEQTLLLMRWFHCVKVPDTVLQPDHPFHALFTDAEPPHLFVANRDGSGAITMNGQQTQSQLWKAMYEVLGRFYEEDPAVAVKERLKLLNDFDRLDSMASDVATRIDKELEKNGPKSAKLAKLKNELDQIKAEKAKLIEREKQVADLKLKAQPAPSNQRAGE
jgi:hypothetical protein